MCNELRPRDAPQGRPAAVPLPALQPQVRAHRKPRQPKKKKALLGFLQDTVKLRFRHPVRREKQRPDAIQAAAGFQKRRDHFFQRRNPERMFVQARNLREFLPARRQKCLAAANADFLQRLQAVRNKRRADDQHAFSPPLRQTRPVRNPCKVSATGPAQPRLKGHGPFSRRHAGLFHESAAVLKHCAR